MLTCAVGSLTVPVVTANYQDFPEVPEELPPGGQLVDRDGLKVVTDDGRWEIVLGWKWDGEDRMVFGSMAIRPRLTLDRELPPLTSTVLQSLPISRWLADARSVVAREMREVAQDLHDGDPSLAAEILRRTEVLEGSQARPRRTGRTDTYRRVAEAYLHVQATQGTRGINRRVAEILGGEDGPIPEGTFRDWLRKTTELGYLTPGQRGRAGRMPGPALLQPTEQQEESSE